MYPGEFLNFLMSLQTSTNSNISCYRILIKFSNEGNYLNLQNQLMKKQIYLKVKQTCYRLKHSTQPVLEKKSTQVFSGFKTIWFWLCWHTAMILETMNI